MDTSLIKSVYVPDYCLEGSDLPAHILWDKNVKLKIRVHHGKQFDVKNVFNVGLDQLKAEEGCIKLEGFEMNGYVAFLFVPHIGDEKVQHLKIEFEFLNEDTSDHLTITKEVKVFRPKVKLIKVPREINVYFDKKTKKWNVEPKIQLENEGEGTGLISLEIEKSTEAEILPPGRIDEFFRGFLDVLENRLRDTSKRFEEYNELIDAYLDFITSPGQLTSIDFEEKYKSLLLEFGNAFDNNKGFREDILKDIYVAYISNVELITEMKSFLQYINSIAAGKIMLTNSLDSISTHEADVEIRPNISLKDLSFNSYEPIKLKKIKIHSEEGATFPIHNLFHWRQPTSGSLELKE